MPNDLTEDTKRPVAARADVPAESSWLRVLTRPLAAAVVLAIFWFIMLSSVREKSLTADEAAHAAAGYSYWKFNDYRLDPENGNLPQRVMALPLVGSGYRFPPTDGEMWQSADAGVVGDAWFHQLGNDVPGMLRKGRGVMGLLTVAWGALVWYWARQLFGALGGMLSLLLFVTSPTILANGSLMVSDATCALFFTASLFAIWAMLRRLTAWRVIASAVIIGGLFVSKMSAVLIIPIGLTLALGRLIDGRPLWIGFGLNRELTRRPQQALALVGALAAYVLIIPLTVWAFYGFRYAAFAPSASAMAGFRVPWEFVLDKPSPLALLEQLNLSVEQKARADEILQRYDWQREAAPAVLAVQQAVLTTEQARKLEAAMTAPAPQLAARVADFFRRHELLPEAYVYGAAHVWRFSRMRAAFYNGEYGATGWKSFFPYTVLVKTPLAVFGIVALAAAAAFWRWRDAVREGASRWRCFGAGCYETLPLWIMLAFYWAAVIPSHLNLGHRYVLPTYAPVFVLCGAAAWWLQAGQSRSRAEKPDLAMGRMVKVGGLAVCALFVAALVETAYRYPHYLSYFNGIVAPSQAYRHLVDSSLDWGQDLPGVKRYMDAHAGDAPFYLSYFGAARPETYGISATLLICGSGIDQPRTPLREVRAPSGELSLYLVQANRAWPDSEMLSKTPLPNDWVRVTFMQQPAVPRLLKGTYFISATMLPTIWAAMDGPLGPWNARFEATYQDLRRTIEPLLHGEAPGRAQAFATRPVERWEEIFESFAQFRFARLTAYLRQREPDDHIGFSILVYKLTAADIERALHGPAPELGVDFPRVLMQQAEL